MRKDLLSCGLFILSILTTLAGVSVVQDRDAYMKIGVYEVRPYKHGLYLTVPGSGYFYNFSPFEDYFEVNGAKIPLLSNPSSMSREFADLSKPERIFYTINSYFDQTKVTATFRESDNTLLYKATRRGNTVYISVVSSKSTEGLVLTMSFDEDDKVTETTGYIVINNPEFNGAFKILRESDSHTVRSVNMVDNLVEFTTKDKNMPTVEVMILDSLEEALR